MKIRLVGAEMNTKKDEKTGGRMDMTKKQGASRDAANASRKGLK